MPFLSWQFIFFFIVVALAHYRLPPSRRWLILLLASLIYGASWGAGALVVLLLCSAAAYLAGLGLARAEGLARRLWLGLGIGVPLAALVWFRVAGFLPLTTPAQPIGLSFYSLQLIAYLLEVHRRRIEPERHAGRFAVFAAFFPSLTSGPIGRAAALLPQLRDPRRPDPARLADGLRLILWGVFKKVVVADRLGIYVDGVYTNPALAQSLHIAIALYFFAFQLYCDFSAYSDIVVGLARLLGIDLMHNFRRPYLAASIQDFWSRWHISLTTWLRDYLYLPLVRRRLQRGGDSQALKLSDYHIVLVFFLSGVWHGAGWTFAVWGALHGLYLLAANWRAAWATRRGLPGAAPTGWRRVFAVLATFHLTLLAWMFFRAESLEKAFAVFGRLAAWSGLPDLQGLTGALSPREFVLALGGILIVLVVEAWAERHAAADMGAAARLLSPRLRWAASYAAALAILLFGIFAESSFLYFEF